MPLGLVADDRVRRGGDLLAPIGGSERPNCQLITANILLATFFEGFHNRSVNADHGIPAELRNLFLLGLVTKSIDISR